MNLHENIPDTIKVGVAISPPSLQFLGVPVQDWSLVLSALVSLLFIIEKIPMILQRIKGAIKWIKGLRKD